MNVENKYAPLLRLRSLLFSYFFSTEVLPRQIVRTGSYQSRLFDYVRTTLFGKYFDFGVPLIAIRTISEEKDHAHAILVRMLKLKVSHIAPSIVYINL